MGTGQFLCDFRRDYHITKSLAHRKAVTQTKQKANEKWMKVHFQHIEQDRSPGKKVSHVRLLLLVNELKDNGLTCLCTKNELQRLCNGYNVRYLLKWNKGKLSAELAHAILHCENMPSSPVTSKYVVAIIVREDQPALIPVLNLRRL
ncbi:Hypothetical predicted protein [Paramuricea clavata]|uniref:Uncharacterized protein n=1 Tax=Paramuricea clavata TaxID=317549 RepID=A0A6S7GRL5_PARCT|nr:Hypothetical predicted protein [Paramuricea clavata]